MCAVKNVLTMVTLVTMAHGGIAPPNIDQVRYAVNTLRGRTPHEQRIDGIGRPLFTLSGSKGDVNGYTQYSQIGSMSTAEDCSWEGVSSSVSYSTSLSTLQSQSQSSSNGVDQEISLGASISVDAVELSAETSIRNALIFGNSQTSVKQHAEKQSGMTYTFDAKSRRTLYSVLVDWDVFQSSWWSSEVLQACTNLGSSPTDSAVAGFFNTIGTHGLKTASFGQKCASSVFMEDGSTMTSYYELNEEAQDVNFGLLWWTTTSSTSKSDSTAQESEFGFSYHFANQYCTGELQASSSCGNLKGNGAYNAPAVVKWLYKPIWEMNIPTLSSGAKAKMKLVYDNMVQGAINCRRDSCNGHGSCAPNQLAWSTIPSSIAYNSFFDGTKCFCDDEFVGSTCNTGRTIQVGAPRKPTAWQNDYDGLFTVTGSVNSQESPFCGVESQHNNYNEDRVFKFSPCQIAESEYATKREASREKLVVTNYDEAWVRECTTDRVMTYVKSWHSNDHEDRQFEFECQAYTNVVTKNCAWSQNYVNSFDGYFDFKCDSGKVIAGVDSYHDDYTEDRRFKFKCCELQVDTTQYYNIEKTAWSAYKNSLDGRLNVWTTTNRAYCGVSSYHDNDTEDRRFRFKECYPANGAATTGTMWYSGWSAYDAYASLTCPANMVLRWLDSYHDNTREDRIFKIGCQAFVGQTIGYCYWTPHVNNWDGAFDFECPSQYVLRGMRSWHDNDYEDRRWQYQCCKWQFEISS